MAFESLLLAVVEEKTLEYPEFMFGVGLGFGYGEGKEKKEIFFFFWFLALVLALALALVALQPGSVSTISFISCYRTRA